jgi:hypothetical protein
MNKEIGAEEVKTEIPDEKLSVWQRIKKWVVGGTTAAVTIGAITVGVVSKSGHDEGDIYVINPVTQDSVWFADTIEAKAVADSFAKICLIKEILVPQKTVNEKVFLDTLGNFEMRDRIIPQHIETEQARVSNMLNLKEGSILKGVFTLDDSTVAVLYYKISKEFEGVRPWAGKMVIK